MSIANTKSRPSLVENSAQSDSTQSNPQAARSSGGSKGLLWTGRILTTLATLFLLFDAFGKFAVPRPVVDAFARLGIPITLSVSIGVLLLVSTVLAVPLQLLLNFWSKHGQELAISASEVESAAAGVGDGFAASHAEAMAG
jgi:hypothetical protein